MKEMNLTLWDWSKEQQDTPESNQRIIDAFSKGCNSIQRIKEHRDFIEESQNRFNMIYGHGHRSLQYLWKLLVDEMPNEFKFLEIGVYKGQILSLIEMLAELSNKKPQIFGITPLVDVDFAPYDRTPFIQNIFKQFNLNINNTTIYNGLSQNSNIEQEAYKNGPYDMLYIDGDHSYKSTVYDIEHYSSMVKEGGYLIIDDCNDYKNFLPGTFKGIVEVSNAVRDTIEKNASFKEVLTCMHVRVWQREKEVDVEPEEFWGNMWK